MSIYTKNSNNIYFLNDKNVASSMNDATVLSNAIPSFDIVSAAYDELENLCVNVNLSIGNLCSEITNGTNDLFAVSTAISTRVDINRTADKAELSNTLSTYTNQICSNISVQVQLNRTADKTELCATLSSYANQLCSAISTRIDADNYAIASTLDISYEQATHDIVVQMTGKDGTAISSRLSFDSIAGTGIVDHVEILLPPEVASPKIRIWWQPYVEGGGETNRSTTINITDLAQIYNAGEGIEITPELTISATNVLARTAALNGVASTLNTLSSVTVPVLEEQIKTATIFAGKISFDKYAPDWALDYPDNKLSSIFKYLNLDDVVTNSIKNGNMYEIVLLDTTYPLSNTTFAADQSYTTSDGFVLAHKDWLYITVDTSDAYVPLSALNSTTVKIIQTTRFFEHNQLSNTIHNNYFWLSGGNNATATYQISVYNNGGNPELCSTVGHSIGGNNRFLDGNNVFDGSNYIEHLSTATLSTNYLSVYNIDINNLSVNDADINTLSVYDADIDNLSVVILSTNNLSAYNADITNLSSNNLTVINDVSVGNNISVAGNGVFAGDLNANNVYATNITTISNDLSTKIWIKDPSDAQLSDGVYSDLSVEKINITDYKNLVLNNLTDPRTIYVVSSDYIEAYGQVISNMIMTVDAVQSEAASQHYVDAIKQNIDLSIGQLCSEISGLSALTLSGLSSKIDTVVSAVSGNLAAFNTAGNVYDSLLPVSSMLVLDNLGQIAQMTYLPTIHLKNKTPGLLLYAHELWVETNEFGEDYLVVGSKVRIDPTPLSGAFTGAYDGNLSDYRNYELSTLPEIVDYVTLDETASNNPSSGTISCDKLVVTGSGVIENGNYYCDVYLYDSASIISGTFYGTIYNYTNTIYGGIYYGNVVNEVSGIIEGGTFKSGCTITNKHYIKGGTFEAGCSVDNLSGTILNGTFSDPKLTYNGLVYGGTFNSIYAGTTWFFTNGYLLSDNSFISGDNNWETLNNWNYLPNARGNAISSIPWLDNSTADKNLAYGDTFHSTVILTSNIANGTDISGICDLDIDNNGTIFNGKFTGAVDNLDGTIEGGYFVYSAAEIGGNILSGATFDWSPPGPYGG